MKCKDFRRSTLPLVVFVIAHSIQGHLVDVIVRNPDLTKGCEYPARVQVTIADHKQQTELDLILDKVIQDGKTPTYVAGAEQGGHKDIVHEIDVTLQESREYSHLVHQAALQVACLMSSTGTPYFKFSGQMKFPDGRIFDLQPDNALLSNKLVHILTEVETNLEDRKFDRPLHAIAQWDVQEAHRGTRRYRRGNDDEDEDDEEDNEEEEEDDDDDDDDGDDDDEEEEEEDDDDDDGNDDDDDGVDVGSPNFVYENSGSATFTLKSDYFKDQTDDGDDITVKAVDGSALERRDFDFVSFSVVDDNVIITLNITDNDVTDGERTLDLRADMFSATITILDDEGDRPFDCRRAGQECFRPDINVCYSGWHICKCGGSYEGQMCNFNPEHEGNGTLDCGENGFEYQPPNTDPVCHCRPGYYGDVCQHYYLDVECDGEMMQFSAKPHGNFTGHIFVMDKRDVPECELNTTVFRESGIEGYELSVPHISASCGSTTVKTVGEEILFSRSFVIQYFPMATSVDQIITAECAFNTSKRLSAGFALSTKFDTINTHHINSDAKVPVAIVFYGNSRVLQNADLVDIGTEVCLELSVTGGFSGVEIRTITFASGPEDDAARFGVYHEGCQDSNMDGVMSVSPFYTQSPEKTTIKFCFKTFKFSASDVLTIDLVLRICVNETSDCQVRVCVPGNSPGRKKRDVGYFTEIREMKFLHISEDLTATTETQQGTGRMKTELIGMLVLLGCLILALTVAVAVVVRISTRRKHMKISGYE